uniref:4-coumarate--CoA ligase n=1 Tax=Panagrellus redivivus TaxID=6233 RepID=A0A7E4VL38_PANRE
MVIVKSTYPTVPVAHEPFGETMLANLWTHAVNNPNKKAIISATNENISVTYAELYLQSLSVSSFLEDRHFGHGDVACLVLPNSLQWASIFFGVALQGGAVSGASVVFTDYELARQFQDSKSKLVFCSVASLDRVLKAAKTCPRLSTIVVVEPLEGQIPPPDTHYPFGVIKFSEVLKTRPAIGRPSKDIDVRRDLLILPYSSGTTGSPKGVMLSHLNFGTMLNVINDQLLRTMNFKGNYDPTKEHQLALLPFYHIYGLGVIMHLLAVGSTVVVMDHFDLEVYLRSIQKYRIRNLWLVPPILVALAKHPIVAKYDVSCIETIVSGAAPAGKDLVDELKKRLPQVEVLQGYGMTECGMASHLPDITNYVQGSVGRVCANCEMKIIDVETSKELGFNEKGEICVRSPMVMLGYLGRPQATAETIDDDGWLHTGDIGYVTEDGSVFIVERLKELIKVKGLQVPPAELEDVLLSHPQIHDAAVIGIPDAAAGEVPKAFIVRSNPNLTEQQVAEYVKERVAHYKQLKGGVEFIKEVPKSAAGKILRRFLRDQSQKNQISKL